MKEPSGYSYPGGEKSLESGALLAKVLSSSVRLGVVDLLSRNGPMRSTEIAALLNLSETQLGNHLKRLRDAQVVSVDRRGKAAVYHISSERVSALAGMLLEKQHGYVPSEEGGASALRYARSCYDHLAGELGVRLCSWMLDHHALSVREDETICLGPECEPILIEIGVGLTGLTSSARRLAFFCPDWTHNAHHLGGILGAAILESFLQKGWLMGVPGSRRLQVDSSGEAFFQALV